jgi:hypothetical protein
MLAGEGQNALDDHVVERDRLHERLQVVGTAGQPVDSALEHLVEELVEPGVDVHAGLRDPSLQGVGLEDSDLVVKAVEEAYVARLVGDLRAVLSESVTQRTGAQTSRPRRPGRARVRRPRRGPPVFSAWVWRPEPSVLNGWLTSQVPGAAPDTCMAAAPLGSLMDPARRAVRACGPAKSPCQGPGSAVASIRTLAPPPAGVPTIDAPGRRPSNVVDTEPSALLTLTVSPLNRRAYSRPSAERSSTRIEMNAGTRTTRGVIFPPRPVNRASERAGSSSPAPPGASSGEVSGGGSTVSVGSSSGSVSSCWGWVSVTVGGGGGDFSVCVCVAVADVPSSSSSPHPASTSTITAPSAASSRGLRHLRGVPIKPMVELRCGNVGNTVIS